MSAILLETNGRTSSSKRTKHIKVKYCLIKDKVDRGEITIEHCPTEQMWMDINTKPNQGAVFRAFRGQVMGIPAEYNDASFATKCNFRQPTWVPEPVSMLPTPRDPVAAKECVAERRTDGRLVLGSESPEKERRVRFAVDMPTAEPTNQDQRAPIKMVGGRAHGARESTGL